MSELRDLYQEVILDHSKKPHNFKRLESPCCRAEGFNPLCGDQLSLFVRVDDGIIRDIGFEGSGCAISKASASMMTAAVKGKTAAQAELLFEHFHKMVTGQPGDPFDAEIMGKLAVFSGVCEFPARVKCASLAWHTLKAALEGAGVPVSTE
ncbi:MAG: SUF system NifU family Fe-S cluster assembly protein [Candidatus Wallbacteria bacterium]|nr:SUF system NifU family Fe-S cluster assembly protein [Candidatus Wallbacteria bacterium]